jgi:hypothetical protein
MKPLLTMGGQLLEPHRCWSRVRLPAQGVIALPYRYRRKI